MKQILKAVAVWCMRMQKKSLAGAISGFFAAFATSALLITSVSAGADTQYVYDAAGRLTNVGVPSGASSTYNYDAVGNITSVGSTAASPLSLLAFTPARGVAGTRVVVQGFGFSTVASNNIVKFNNVTATVASATTSMLTVTVPTSATTGNISVTNSNGTVTSTKPFVIADTLAVDADPVLVSVTEGSPRTFTFQGQQGQLLSVSANGMYLPLGAAVSTPNLEIRVTGPATTNPSWFEAKVAAGSSSFGYSLPRLAETGTHTVTLTGTAGFSLSIKSDATDTLPLNTPRLFKNASFGQAVTYNFDGLAGKVYEFYMENNTLGQTARAFKPDGSEFAHMNLDPTGGGIMNANENDFKQPGTLNQLFSVGPLPSNGIYSLRVGENLEAVSKLGSVTVTNREVPPVSGTVVVNGSALSVNIAPYTAARYIFNGTAGQELSLVIPDPFQGYSSHLYVEILDPDGRQLTTSMCRGYCYTWLQQDVQTGSAEIALPPLAKTGVYTIAFKTYGVSVATNIRMFSNVQGSIVAGQTVLYAPTQYGRIYSYQFDASAGNDIVFQFAHAGIPAMAALQIVDLTGNVLAELELNSNAWTYDFTDGNGLFIWHDVPATGRYKLRVLEDSNVSASLSITMVQPFQAVAVVPGSPPRSLSLLPNQPAKFTFNCAAGQGLSVVLDSLALSPATGVMTVRLLNPLGQTMAEFPYQGPSVPLPWISKAGIYTLILDPGSAGASMTYQLVPDALSTITVGGPSASFAPTRAGQINTYTFHRDADQKLSILFSDNTLLADVSLNLLTPIGNVMEAKSLVPASALSIVPMFSNDYSASSDYYVLRMRAPESTTGHVNIKIVSTMVGSLTVDGGSVSGSLQPGQLMNYSFEGTKGQLLGLGFSNLVLAPAGSTLSVKVISPGIGDAGTGTVSATFPGVPLLRLPTTGRYTIELDPGIASASYSIRLMSDAINTIVPNGAVATYSPTVIGQSTSYQFTATAGQSLAMGISTYTIPATTRMVAYLPDGTEWRWGTQKSGTDPTGLELYGLPFSGTYTLRFLGEAVPAGSANFSVYNGRITSSIALDSAPITVRLKVFQEAVATFTATAGKAVSFLVTDYVIKPVDRQMNVIVSDPAGQVIDRFVANNGVHHVPVLNLTGTYSIKMEPNGGAVSFRTQLLSDDGGHLVVDGASASIAPTRADQAFSYTFDGVTGQNLNVVFSANSNLSGLYTFSVVNPDGVVLIADSLSRGVNKSFSLPNLTMNGTYRLRLFATQPGGGVSVSVISPLERTLQADALASAVTTAVGQDVHFTFTGAVGQSLGVGITNVQAAPVNSVLLVSVITPSGELLASRDFTAATGLSLPVLTQSGTYRVVVHPLSSASSSFSIRLNSDLLATLPISQTGVSFAPVSVGQSGSFTFTASSGQNLGLMIMPGTTLADYSVVDILKPDGSLLKSSDFNSSGTTMQLANLSQGSYKARIRPRSGVLGSVTLKLNDAVVGDLVVDGPGVSVQLAAGQQAIYTFDGLPGQILGIGITDLASQPVNSHITIDILNPGGSVARALGTTVSPVGLSLASLTQPGKYTVRVNPGSASSSFKIWLSAASAINLSGEAGQTVFSPTRPGQGLAMSVYLNAGDSAQLSVDGSSIPGMPWVNMTAAGIAPGSQYGYQSINAAGKKWYLGAAQVSGVHTVVFGPSAAATGSATVYLARTLSGSLQPNVPVQVNLLPGQLGRFKYTHPYSGMGLAVSNLVTTPAGGNLNWYTERGAIPCCDIFTSPLPATHQSGVLLTDLLGGQAILQLGSELKASSFTVQLVPTNEATLAIDGAAATYSISNLAQATRYRFSVASARTLSLVLSSSTIAEGVQVKLENPSGFAVNYYALPAGTSNGTFTLALPYDGEFRVLVSSVNSTSGSVNIRLIAPASGALQLNTPLAVNLQAGQSGRFSFTGTVGQTLGLALYNLAPTNSSIKAKVFDPSGYEVARLNVNGSKGGQTLPRLSQTGQYVVQLENAPDNAASLNLAVVSDAQGALTINGASLVFTPVIVGQGASYTVAATAGQTASLMLSNNTLVGNLTVQVYDVNGAIIGIQPTLVYTSGLGTHRTQSYTFPSAGTYTIRISGTIVSSGSVAVGIGSAVTGNLVIGSPFTSALPANQHGSYSFIVTTERQRLGLTYSAYSSTPSGTALSLKVVNGVGNVVASLSSPTAQSGVVLPLLSGGAYTVEAYSGNGSATFTLKLIADATGTLVANGAENQFNATVPGQAVSYSFTGTAGRNTRLLVTNTLSDVAIVDVYRPDGVLLASRSLDVSSVAVAWDLPALTASGSYSVRVSPAPGASGTIKVALKQDVTGTLVAGGSAVAITLATAQPGTYSFAGTLNQYLSLALTGLTTTPAAQNVVVSIVRPDGSSLASFTASGTGSSLVLPPLPQAGNYVVKLDPGVNAASFSMRLLSDISGTLPDNTVTTFTIGTAGQACNYSFNGTAGRAYRLLYSASTLPASTTVTVYKPDSTVLFSEAITSTSLMSELPVLPDTGTYKVRLAPASLAAGSLSLQLRPPLSGSLTVGGTPTTVNALTYQKAQYTFAGTVGQKLGMSISALSTSPVNRGLTFSMYKPDGSVLASGPITGSGGSYTPNPLPVAGTYSIGLDPGSASAQYTMRVNPDVVGSLANGGSSLNFVPALTGQAASYSFSGIATQNLNLLLTANTIPGTTKIQVYFPSGVLWTSATLSYSSGAATSSTLALTGLPTTGSYVVRLIPPSAAVVSGSMTVALRVQ